MNLDPDKRPLSVKFEKTVFLCIKLKPIKKERFSQ